LSFEPIEQEIILTPEMELLIGQREQARQAKNWARSDELREELRKLGYEVQDKKVS
jgi:cysteinyl-tRNA synthetase